MNILQRNKKTLFGYGGGWGVDNHSMPGDLNKFHITQASIIGWKENPVITTIESAAYPMDNLQFPTVTICPGK